MFKPSDLSESKPMGPMSTLEAQIREAQQEAEKWKTRFILLAAAFILVVLLFGQRPFERWAGLKHEPPSELLDNASHGAY